MNVLIITDVLWRNDNGVGNSYSNLFKDMDGVKIANICCMEGVSDNEESTSCLQISEGMLLRNLKNRSVPTFKIETKAINVNKTQAPEKGLLKFMKRSRLQIFFWIRNLIWKLV